MANSNLSPDEQYGRSTKKRPVYADVTEYPKMLYNIDHTFLVVQSRAEEDAKMEENSKGKVIWALSPAVFGIETAPAGKEIQDRPGTW